MLPVPFPILLHTHNFALATKWLRLPGVAFPLRRAYRRSIGRSGSQGWGPQQQGTASTGRDALRWRPLCMAHTFSSPTPETAAPSCAAPDPPSRYASTIPAALLAAAVLERTLFLTGCRPDLLPVGLQLSRDHSTADNKERQRIVEAGGSVSWRVDSWRVGEAAIQVMRQELVATRVMVAGA